MIVLCIWWYCWTYVNAVLQGWSQRGDRVDGEVCGEEHPPASTTEGHHMRSCGAGVQPFLHLYPGSSQLLWIWAVVVYTHSIYIYCIYEREVSYHTNGKKWPVDFSSLVCGTVIFLVGGGDLTQNSVWHLGLVSGLFLFCMEPEGHLDAGSTQCQLACLVTQLSTTLKCTRRSSPAVYTLIKITFVLWSAPVVYYFMQ